MADKKDKSKETKSGDQKKVAAKAPKAAGKVKAAAAEAKADATSSETKQKKEAERIPTPRMKKRYHDVVVPAMMKPTWNV